MLRSAARRLLGRRRRATPERIALDVLFDEMERVPPHVDGVVDLGCYQLHYCDVRTLATQWNELFVQERLRFNAAVSAPRILDCGANMGVASMYFKRLYPSARIIAFEADPAIGRICRRNFAENGLSDIELINAAVWTHDGQVPFCCEGGDSGTLSDLKYQGLEGERREVPAVRLRRYLEAEAIDLLKLDIEGAEFDVLADCEPALANVSRLILEIHETNPTKRGTAAVLGMLAKAGYKFTMDSLLPMTWRGEPLGEHEAFPGKRSAWVVMIYAWRDAS